MHIDKKSILFLLSTLLPSAAMWADDTTFSVASGSVNITYLKTGENTCQVGNSALSIDKTTEGELTIPSTVSDGSVTYTVTAIGNKAFAACSKLTKVTLPTSVTTIGNQAFQSCTSLTTINLENVTTLGTYAFMSCSKLVNPNVSNVTSIGTYAFGNCTAITTLNLNSPKSAEL